MIRKYKKTDADAIVSAWRRASELAHAFLPKEFLDQEADNVRNVYPVYAEIWVIEIENRVVGFIALVDDEIGGLFLDPEYHGRGYGKALVDQAVAEKGAVRVEVFKRNTIGRNFYKSYGFVGEEVSFHEASGQQVMQLSFARRQAM